MVRKLPLLTSHLETPTCASQTSTAFVSHVQQVDGSMISFTSSLIQQSSGLLSSFHSAIPHESTKFPTPVSLCPRKKFSFCPPSNIKTLPLRPQENIPKVNSGIFQFNPHSVSMQRRVCYQAGPVLTAEPRHSPTIPPTAILNPTHCTNQELTIGLSFNCHTLNE